MAVGKDQDAVRSEPTRGHRSQRQERQEQQEPAGPCQRQAPPSTSGARRHLHRHHSTRNHRLAPLIGQHQDRVGAGHAAAVLHRTHVRRLTSVTINCSSSYRSDFSCRLRAAGFCATLSGCRCCAQRAVIVELKLHRPFSRHRGALVASILARVATAPVVEGWQRCARSRKRVRASTLGASGSRALGAWRVTYNLPFRERVQARTDGPKRARPPALELLTAAACDCCKWVLHGHGPVRPSVRAVEVGEGKIGSCSQPRSATPRRKPAPP